MGSHRVRHSVLIFLSIIWMLPVYLLLVNAFSDVAKYNATFSWVPKGFTPIQNFQAAWKVADLTPGLISNIIYAGGGGAIAVLFAALAAFSIIILQPKYPMMWFWIIYGVNLIPFQMFLTPLFRMSASLGLYDTRLWLTIVYIGIAIPFAFFLARNHMLSIPYEIVEASRLDGASSFRIFFQIFLPLSWPALGAAFIFQFTWIWNDLLFGLTLTRSPEVRPLMTTLVTLVGQYQSIPAPVVLTTTLITSIPVMILFLAAQKLFVQALRSGS